MPPNRGAKVQLLTVGGISTTGQWYGELGQYLLAWAPLLERDKAREAVILAARRSVPIFVGMDFGGDDAAVVTVTAIQDWRAPRD
ncbi:hypothetical protein HTY52_12910 [Cupriavidus taiwanensis]|uniref:hypothetical protein n=1 Tax=Cupriavidus taiwanensis TaxID=164546 RepID=UPI001574BA58|nr:hypothetical protein [Cupriavidus taiwanensis]NSX14976.1 hypothetical protein [Cupriavidus taiwanensis]